MDGSKEVVIELKRFKNMDKIKFIELGINARIKRFIKECISTANWESSFIKSLI
jgi:hypothetical protein